MLAQAQFNDILEWIVPAIFIFIVIASHIWKVISGLAQQNQRPNQPRPNLPGERPVPPPAQQPKPVEQSQLNAEIEQFLRRANERRAEKAKRASGKSEPIAPQKPSRPQPVAAQSKPRPKKRRDFDAVAESVREHLDSRRLEQHTSTLGKHASTLGKDIVQADSQFEQHLRAAFDHRVGTLADDSPAAAPPPDALPTPGEDRARAVAGLALTPGNIRQAVLLKEILERPVDRW